VDAVGQLKLVELRREAHRHAFPLACKEIDQHAEAGSKPAAAARARPACHK